MAAWLVVVVPPRDGRLGGCMTLGAHQNLDLAIDHVSDLLRKQIFNHDPAWPSDINSYHVIQDDSFVITGKIE